MLKVGIVIISVTKAQADRHKARRARGARVHHCMYTSMYYQTVYQNRQNDHSATKQRETHRETVTRKRERELSRV